MVAFVLMIGLQYAVARLQVSSRSFARAVTNPPTLLYFRGQFLRDGMRKARVTEQELHGVGRKKGQGSLDDIEALVLEASGDVAVVKTIGNGSALGDALHKQIPDGTQER